MSPTEAIAIADAVPADQARIEQLLQAADLPAGRELRADVVLVARSGSELLGTVALEVFGSAGLLRSLVVDPGARGRGIADRLLDHLLARALQRGVETLWLLTIGAAPYFARWGFSVVPRAGAPAAILAHAQFRALCPSTAACMQRSLRGSARAFPKGSLPLLPDVPGARCFAVALEQAELTYYEIRPGTRFPRHAHDVEQITLVLDGELRFEVDDRPPIRLGAGEAVALPSGVPHAVVAGAAPVRAVDAWSKSPVSSRIGTSRAGTRGNIENLAGSMVGLASRQALERWFERTFPESLPVARAPAILERLRGTPARVEETVLGASRAALTRRSGTSWTAQEHVGHLGDLEALFCARLDDFDAGAAALRPTDLDNRATTEAGHDRRDLAELLRRFRAARARLVARLSSWDPARLARTALHPRLQRPFSVVDHAHFVAEHDDHHLAAIRALLADPAGGP